MANGLLVASPRLKRVGSPRDSAADPPEESPLLPARRVQIIVALLGAWIAYGALESILWRRQLWGAHFLAYLPPAWWGVVPVALAALAALTLLGARTGGGPARAHLRVDALLPFAPYGAAAVAAVLFWALRVRHLFWGDSLPLSISIPQGQTFHPDEPLSLYFGHLLYRLGRGHWSGAEAVAIGSTLCGALFVGRTVQWFSSRIADRGIAALAAACLLTQGFVVIFCGYVENYAYLAVALLFFLTWGVDFLEGRVGPFRPLAASLVASALHVLGWLTMVPALALVVVGLADRGRRARTAFATAAVVAAGVLGVSLTAGLYDGGTPVARFTGAVQKLLLPVVATPAARLDLARRLGDIWSQVTIVGPLSVPWLVALLVLMRGMSFARTRAGAFLLLASAVYSAPMIFIGGWGIGPARDWDIFAAPAVAAALCGVILVARQARDGQARTILLAVLVASLFHTLPWVALNTSHDRSMARVAELPLGRGRSQMMLGTYFLNSGRLRDAEASFRRSLIEDSTNVNSQSGLGLALARQGRLAEALPPMSRAVNLAPNKIPYRNDLIALLLALDRRSDAVRQMGALLHLDPRNRSAWLALSEGYLALGRPDSAGLVLEAGLSYLPDDPQLLDALSRMPAARDSGP